MRCGNLVTAVSAEVFGELEFGDLHGLWFGDFFDEYGLEACWFVELASAVVAVVFECDYCFVWFGCWAGGSFEAWWSAAWFGRLVAVFPFGKTSLRWWRVGVFVESKPAF